MLTSTLALLKGRRFGAMIIVILGVFASGYAQSNECSDSDQGPRSLVRSVKIVARWAPEITLPIKRSDEFTPDKIRETRLAIIKAVGAEKAKYNSESIHLGKLPIVLMDVNYVRVCGRKVPEKDCLSDGLTKNCVNVEVHILALSTDPAYLGSLFLPIPRSNKFTFLGNVSRPIRVLNPKFSMDHDEMLGTTVGFELSTDLLSLDRTITGKPEVAKKTSLVLTAKTRKSVNKSFYNSQAQLSFLAREPTEHVESIGLEASFASDMEPERVSSYRRNTFRIGGHLAFAPALGLLNQIFLGAGYRRSQNDLSGDGVRSRISTAESSYDARVILDGRLLNGFTRLGFWLDGGSPKNASSSYTRVAGLIGYEKDIPVSGHTIGIEAIGGAGWVSRNTPEYALFYGGNQLNNFLYQDTRESGLNFLPAGPLMRSFGKNQAGVPVSGNRQVGVDSYRHFNLTLSIPIPGLSKPLIPDEVVNDNPRITLRDLVDFAVNTGEESLSSNLQDEGMTEDEADKSAAKVFSEIRPGIKFLTNYAKLYAVKPILMFDASTMSRRGIGSYTRYAFGGGIQLTVAVAKFELGYLSTEHRVGGDRRGNFVARFIFQNLF